VGRLFAGGKTQISLIAKKIKNSKTSVSLENISLQTDVFRFSNFQKFNEICVFLDDLDFRYTNVKSGCFADNYNKCN